MRIEVLGRRAAKMLQVSSAEGRYASKGKMVQTLQLVEEVVDRGDLDVLAVREMYALERCALCETIDGLVGEVGDLVDQSQMTAVSFRRLHLKLMATSDTGPTRTSPIRFSLGRFSASCSTLRSVRFGQQARSMYLSRVQAFASAVTALSVMLERLHKPISHYYSGVAPHQQRA
jgi:hypothetical protein